MTYLVEGLVAELRAADQRGAGRVEQTSHGVVNIERLHALDQHAAAVSSFSLLSIPGLLQMPGYGLAVLKAANPRVPEPELRRWTLLKSARSAGFVDRLRRGALKASFTVGEQAFVHAAGICTLAAHEQQLHRLLEVADIPGVSLHVLPFHSVPAQFLTNLLVWTFDQEPAGDEEPLRKHVGYAETAFGGGYTTRSDDLSRMHGGYADLVSAAMPPSRSRTYLHKLLGS